MKNRLSIKSRYEIKMLILSSVVLFIVACIAVISGFLILDKQDEVIVKRFLQQLIISKTIILKDAFTRVDKEIKTMANDPEIKAAIVSANNNKKPNFDKISKLATSFTAIKIKDLNGNDIYSLGNFTKGAPLNVPVTIPSGSNLLWKNKFTLTNESIIYQDNSPIGSFVAEWPIDVINKLASESLNEKNYICIMRSDKSTTCLTHGNGSNLVFSTQENRDLFVSAVQNQRTALITGLDSNHYRAMVIYSPIKPLGIGLAIKITKKALYQPLWKQLYVIIPLLLLSIIVGTLILYLGILPLLRQIKRFKNRAHSVNSRMRTIVNHVVDGIITCDKQGIIETFNPKASEIFGYSPHEMIHKNFNMLIFDKNDKEHKAENNAILDVIIKTTNQEPIELTGIAKSGKIFPIELTLSEIVLNKRELFIAIILDMSDRQVEKAKLVESENRFLSTFDTVTMGMSLVSLSGQLTKVNAAFCKILGYSEAELLKKDFQNIIHKDDLNKLLAERDKLIEKKSVFSQNEIRYISRADQTIWVMTYITLVRDIKNIPLYFIVQSLDISKQKISEFTYKAHFDPLTGLINGIQLEEDINHIINIAQRNQSIFAFLLVNLDNFKTMNASLGQETGDKLLKIASDRLKSCVRRNDSVARLEQDQFVLVLTELPDMKAAISVTEKIINSLSERININEHQFDMTTNIGISFFPIDGIHYEPLMKNASLALFQAKQKGHNNYLVCTPEISGNIQEKRAFEQSLSRALKNSEFVLHFQPRLDFQTNTIIGLESFLRWENHEYDTVVTPIQIISWAEESDLISPLTNWIIKKACAGTKKCIDDFEGKLNLTINLSAHQFKNPNLIKDLIENMQEMNFNPQNLGIEISENIIMKDPEYSLRILNALKMYGIKVIIDDFGTGYSSIDYLQKLTVDYFKIDQRFVQSILTDPSSRTLIITLIHLANNLGIKVIAGGVETEKQYEFLKQHGCHEAQGYYICRPLPTDEITLFLSKLLVHK